MYFFYYSYNFKKNRDLNMIFRKYFVASFKIYRYIYTLAIPKIETDPAY